MVVLYTTATCPKCKLLKAKMDAKGIEYREETDVSIMKTKSIDAVPVLEVDGSLLEYGNANKWVNERG